MKENIIITTHPSFANSNNSYVDSLIYKLSTVTINEFLENIAKGANQHELDDALISLNRKSKLGCFISRSGNIIYINLFNEIFKAQLKIEPDGKIKFGSSSPDISVVLVIYIFYKLLRESKCPWNFENLEKKWNKISKLARSLYCYSVENDPLYLSSVIIKTDIYSEKEIIENGKNLENLGYIKTLRYEKNTSQIENKKYLVPVDESQSSLFHFIENGTTRKNIWWDRNIDHREFAAWNNLIFVFSDNTSFNLLELINHPYAVVFPVGIIPEGLTAKTKYENFNFWSDDSDSFYELPAKITKILKNIIYNINRQNNKHTKLYIAAKETRISEIPCQEITNIKELLGNENYSWTLSGNKIHGSVCSSEINQNEKLLPIQLRKEEKILILNSFKKQKDKFLKLCEKLHMENEYNKDEGVCCYINTATDINTLKFEFEKNISQNFGVNLNLEQIIPIKDSEIEINFHLEQTKDNLHNIGFDLTINSSNFQAPIKLIGIPTLLFRCLYGTCEGLGQFFYEYENKNIVIQKQGLKRKNELRFLRHAGIFKVLLAEVIRYYNLPSENKEKRKKFENDLLLKSIAMLSDVSLDMNVKIDEHISNKSKNLVKEFINAILDEKTLSSYLFSENNKTFEINLLSPVLKIMECILDWIILTYGETSLQKTTIKELSLVNRLYPTHGLLLGKFSNEVKMFSLFEQTGLGKAVFSFMNDSRYNLYVSGKRIKSINEEQVSSSLEVDGKINWFDMHPQVFFDGHEITFEQLQTIKSNEIIYFKGQPYFINFKNIPKLVFLDRFWAKLKAAAEGKKFSDLEKTNIFVQEKSLLLEILSMRKAGVSITGSDEWNKIASEFDSLMENKVDDLNYTDFKVPLKDYQKIGTQWLLNLYKISLGGILADDMGLGKTIQVIGFLEVLRYRNITDFQLIVVPTSLVYNWISEIKKFAPLLNVSVFESKNKNVYHESWSAVPPHIVIITYGLLTENVELLKQYKWNSVIYDEAQNLKNITSQRTTAARSLSAKSVFCITGTPMENHFGEYFSLIDLCVPGALGDYGDFRQVFSLETFEKKKLQEEINYLRVKTSPLVLRRIKSEMLEQLPDKFESTILLPFEKEQLKIYRDIAISWNEKIKSVIDKDNQTNTQLEMLTALLRLRQVCSNPAMIEDVLYKKNPPKFELLLESVSEIYENGESVLIFTNFLATLFELEKRFKESGYKTHVIHGSLSAKKRQIELDQFQNNPEASILIMTLKTGGVGLNLTKASYVFHIEPWWNPAAENQATDRAHRIGQKKSVQVYKYIMKDSIEEKIQELKVKKNNAFDALFTEESESELAKEKSFSGKLSYSDFEFLIN